jgi:hypothetical protein
MKQFLCISLLLLLGSTSYAATYEVKKTGNSIEQSITGANGEGLTVVRSPKPITHSYATFGCPRKNEGCVLVLLISYDGIVDHSKQPVGIMVDGDIKETRFSFGRTVGLASLEFLGLTVAESIPRLQAISKIRVLIGNVNTETEVVVDTSQFNLSRLKEY